MTPDIRNIVAFCALMTGVQTRSPDYIREKFERYCGPFAAEDAYMWGLDKKNRERLAAWEAEWGIKQPQEELSNGTN